MELYAKMKLMSVDSFKIIQRRMQERFSWAGLMVIKPGDTFHHALGVTFLLTFSSTMNGGGYWGIIHYFV